MWHISCTCSIAAKTKCKKSGRRREKNQKGVKKQKRPNGVKIISFVFPIDKSSRHCILIIDKQDT